MTFKKGNTCGFKKGHTPWNKGVPCSENTKKKISKANKGNMPIPWNKGKYWNKKWKQEQSLRTKKAWAEGKHKNNPTSKGTHSTLGRKMPKLTGKRNGNYKHGKYPLVMKIRTCDKYKKWSRQILEKDDYICQICKKRGCELHADHIKSFADIFKENQIISFHQAMVCSELWNLENGRALCVPCHRQETFKGGGMGAR